MTTFRYKLLKFDISRLLININKCAKFEKKMKIWKVSNSFRFTSFRFLSRFPGTHPRLIKRDDSSSFRTVIPKLGGAHRSGARKNY
jgi:hypothetical protein